MTTKDDDKDKGFELGQISFGVGDKPPAQSPGPPARADAETPGLGTQSVTAAVRTAPTSPDQLMPLLPLRMILVADLIPRREFNAGAAAPEQAVRIDATHFDGLFQKIRPRLAIEVESVLTDGALKRIDLSPTSMRSFRPDGLCREVPLLRSLLDGRLVLERLREGSLTIHQAADELERLWSGSSLARRVLELVQTSEAGGHGAASNAASPAAAPAQQADVARILDMVDTGTTADSTAPIEAQPPPVAAAPAETESKGRFGAFIAAVAKSAQTGKAGARPDVAIARVEKALALQLGAILQHPEVRRLERAWRGVDFVVSRGGRHAGVRLELVCAAPEQAAEALERAIRANAAVEPPVSCAIVDDCIDGTAASLARLEALAEVAEAHTVPLALNGSPELFGYDDLAAIDRLDNKASLYDAPERAPWRSLTGKPCTRWVSLVLNRLLARPAYDARSSRVREAQVVELPADDAAVVWMEPCWGVGALVLESFHKTGWPARITGAREGGTIENLPVHQVRLQYEGAETVAIPTEVLLSVESQRALGRYGVLALASAPNSDEAHVFAAATVYVTPPKRTYDGSTAEPEMRLPRVPLGDQLFVARIVQFLRALGDKIPPDSDPAQVEPVMKAAVLELFANAPPSGPEIDLQIRGEGRAVAVAVTIRPRRYLGVGLEEIALELPLG